MQLTCQYHRFYSITRLRIEMKLWQNTNSPCTKIFQFILDEFGEFEMLYEVESGVPALAFLDLQKPHHLE